MKIAKFCAELTAKGCVIFRHGSRHDVWISPITGKTFSIPRHGSRELSKGLEIQARKTLGV